MKDYVHMLSSPFDSHYYQAILSLRQDDEELSQRLVTTARQFLGAELRAVIGESYSRAYRLVAKCQQLSELEEVIDAKRAIKQRNVDRQATIKTLWETRLNGMQR